MIPSASAFRDGRDDVAIRWTARAETVAEAIARATAIAERREETETRLAGAEEDGEDGAVIEGYPFGVQAILTSSQPMVRTFFVSVLCTSLFPVGKEFDYFGIGEFWDCRSLINDFAAQIRFFGHKGTSFVGGVALKTGNVTTSIFTLDSVSGKDKLPKIR